MKNIKFNNFSYSNQNFNSTNSTKSRPNFRTNFSREKKPFKQTENRNLSSRSENRSLGSSSDQRKNVSSKLKRMINYSNSNLNNNNISNSNTMNSLNKDIPVNYAKKSRYNSADKYKYNYNSNKFKKFFPENIGTFGVGGQHVNLKIGGGLKNSNFIKKENSLIPNECYFGPQHQINININNYNFSSYNSNKEKLIKSSNFSGNPINSSGSLGNKKFTEINILNEINKKSNSNLYSNKDVKESIKDSIKESIRETKDKEGKIKIKKNLQKKVKEFNTKNEKKEIEVNF